MLMRTCLALLTVAAVLTVSTVRAEDGETVQLFNGQNLEGWTYHLNDPNVKMEDVWSVEDGILICKGRPAGYIRTEKDYTSYKLVVEWKWPGGDKRPGNSGVLLRMVGKDKVWPKSIECQLANGGAGDIWNIDQFPMQVAADRTNGRRTQRVKGNEKPIGEWNRYDITLNGGELEMKINGEVVNTASECEVVPGKICLQSEGAEIHFRKVELTPLTE